jgi:uncharacterized secreted protein with C-terminal beta-propeller domain
MPRSSVFVVGAALVVAGLAAGALVDEARAASTTPRLSTFSSCGQLLSYTRTRALGLLRPYGFAGLPARVSMPLTEPAVRDGVSPSTTPPLASAPAIGAPEQGVDYSGTNVQETGVDEPDITKTDGRRLFVATEAAGSAPASVQALDVSDGGAQLASTLRLPADLQGLQLMLSGDRLVVIANASGVTVTTPVPEPTAPPVTPGVVTSPLTQVPSDPAVVLTLIDVSNPAAMKTIETLRLRGTFVTSRLTDTALRLVTSTDPTPLALQGWDGVSPESAAVAVSHNRRAVTKSPLRTWVPTFTVKRGKRTMARGALVPCKEVYRPQRFSGLRMVTVTTIDLGRGLTPTDSDAVQTDGELVYASPTALYVATPRWLDPEDPESRSAVIGMATQIHRFDTSDPRQTVYTGGGAVPGFLLNQFSMSEHEGTLRVASTQMPPWWSPELQSESRVTTLQLRDGALARVGHVGGMGRGERIYAVRFLGDRGYVVTFRQTDPLYTLDLSDPTKPLVRGELKIPGYSAYLHPIDDTLLLGVGQDATAEGRVLGTQVSLFDVTDLANPTRLQQTTFPDSWSEAESDHHAFLYWAPTGLAVIPVSSGATLEAAGFFVSRTSGITRVRRIAHPADPTGLSAIRRSLVVGNTLYTVSGRGVMTSDLSSLVEKGFVPFPGAP